MRLANGLVAAVVLVLSGVQVATGQDSCPGDGLPTFASDGGSFDSFGFSVAIDGDTAIVGAYWDDDRGTDSGSAYVFERVNGVWTEVAKLTASDGQAQDQFGVSVAIDGDTVIVGAFQDDFKGSAYVFERAGGVWTEVAKFTANDGQVGDWFGYSVAIDGDTAIVGALWNDNYRGSNAGSAYTFERVNGIWTQGSKFVANDGQAEDAFGVSVAISGDTIIVGAVGDDDRGTDSGSAYVFERVGFNAWIEAAKFAANDGQAEDGFGYSVAIDGDTAIVGAPRDDDGGFDAGSAYVFERVGVNAWIEAAKLTANDGQAANGWFGRGVAIAGDTAIVGAFRSDLGAESGSAYVFERVSNAWTQTRKITAADRQAGDRFGLSVGIAGDTAIVGAYRDDNRGTDSGSVYFVHPQANPCCADIDRSGVLDANDFFVFLDYFAAGDPHADFTGDGVIDAADFFAYLDAFAAGCP